MAHITFFTKTGCSTSAKQVDLLRESGHEVEVCDLLAHQWTPQELISYFGDLPVEGWFNPNSPRVKSGEILPVAFDREGALAQMVADHLLIRRPLMESGGTRQCGFNPVAVHAWVGLGTTIYEQSAGVDFTSCSQPVTNVPHCP